MPFGMFSLMTVTGAALWCAILAWFGLKVAEHNPNLLDDPAALVHAIKHDLIWIVAAVALVAGLYFLMLRLSARKAE